MNVTVRRAVPEDLDTIALIESRCFPPQEAASREAFRERMAAFPKWFFIAETEDGEPCGMINGMATHEETIDDTMFEDAGLHDESAPVQTVFGFTVLPEYEKQGVARALMEAFVQAAKDAGRRKVTLTCKARLVPMYEHFGYANMGVSRSTHGGAVWYDMDRIL